jgi:hypothetical protein
MQSHPEAPKAETKERDNINPEVIVSKNKSRRHGQTDHVGEN